MVFNVTKDYIRQRRNSRAGSGGVYRIALREGDLGEPGVVAVHDRVELLPVGEPVMARPGGAQVEICLGLGEVVITIRAEGGDVTHQRVTFPDEARAAHVG